MSRRPFDYDPLTGIREYFHWNDETEQFCIESVQDTDDILDENKLRFNSFTSGRDYWGDGLELTGSTHVARIPMVVYQQLLQSGRIHDQVYMRRWLNDPDNAAFRTRPGVL